MKRTKKRTKELEQTSWRELFYDLYASSTGLLWTVMAYIVTEPDPLPDPVHDDFFGMDFDADFADHHDHDVPDHQHDIQDIHDQYGFYPDDHFPY